MTRTHGFRFRFLGGIVLALAGSCALPWSAQTCAFGNGGGAGSGGGGATLLTITVDGNSSDWGPVLANSAQVTFDGEWVSPCSASTDRDCDGYGITGRDLAVFAWTYDSTNIYLYVKRFGSSTNTQTFYFYMDTSSNQRINTGEKVYQVLLSGSNRKTDGTLYTYAAVDGTNGDALVAPAGYPYPDYADGYTVPGSIHTPVPVYSGLIAGFADGTGFEARIPWSGIGVSSGTAIFFHVSSTNNSNPAQVPASIDDNLGGVGGGIGAFAFRLVSVTPDHSSAVSPGHPTVTTYSHTVTNTGTLPDRYDLTAFSSLGFQAELYFGASLAATDLNGDAIWDSVDSAFDSNSDGRPDTPQLLPSEAYVVELRLTAPDGVANVLDETRISAFSQGQSDVCASALDSTALGEVTLTPSPQSLTLTAGGTADYGLTLANGGLEDVVDLRAASSLGWMVEIYDGSTLVARDLTGDGLWDTVDSAYDSNANGRPDFGALSTGTSISFTARVTAPSGAASGVADTVTILAQGAQEGETATAVLHSTVRLRLTLEPSYRTVDGTQKYSGQGKSVFYAHALTNSWSTADSVTLSAASSPAGWTQRFYTDPDGDGSPADGSLIGGPLDLPANGGSVDLILEVVIPSGLTLPLTHVSAVTATGSASAPSVTDEVRVSFVATFEDPGRAVAKNVFSRCQIIYFLGSSLVPASNYRFRLLNPEGTQVHNQTALSDGNGDAWDEYEVAAADPTGTWTLELYNASGTRVDFMSVYVDPPPANPSTVDPIATGEASYALTGENLAITATFNNTSTGADYSGTTYRYLVRTPDLGQFLGDDGVFTAYSGSDATRTTSPHTVYALSSETETVTVNSVEFPVAGLYRIDVTWTGSCGNGIAEGTKYFPVGTTLASYADAGHAEPSDSFGPGSTVHLFGTTYLPTTDHVVAFYSPGGDLVLTQSAGSTADGTLSTDVPESLLGAEGTWTAVVYQSSVLPPPRYVQDDASATSFDSFSLDQTPPLAPEIHQPADGSATTDTTPAISGTAEPNATVSLYLDGSGTPVLVTADGAGNWTYIPPASIGYGDHQVFATATDAAGNVSPASATSQFAVVHEAPVVGGPVVASPFGNAVSGTSSSPVGTTITVSVNGISAGTTTVQADGTWSLTGILGLVGGESVTATAGTGSAQSGVSNTLLVTPYPPIVDSPAYAGATSVTGTSDQPAGSLVTVYLGGLSVGTATVQADGSWTLAGLSTPLSDGDTLTATVTVGGQTSAPSAEVTVAQEAGDVTPSPWVTSPIYAGAVRVSGTSVSPEGTRIDVFVDGAYVGSTTVTSLGTWTLNLPAGAALRDGQAVAATATDEANGLGTSAPSPEVLVSANAADRTPSPVITSPIYAGATSVEGTSSSPQGTRVDVYADGVFLGATTVQAGGSWTLSGIGPLEEGTVLRATATDEAGGHGTSTPSAPVTVLAVRSTPPIVSASLLAGSPATIHGSSVEAAGSVITVYVNGASAGTTTVNADGSWNLPGIVLAAGDLVKATVQASGKSVSADSNVVRVSGDASAVTPPPVISAPIASGATTVSGTAEPGAAVDVYADGVFLGTVTTDALGGWTLAGLPPAEDGAVYTATATLAPDGTSDWSAPVVVGTAIHLLRSDAMTSLTQDRRPLFTHAAATPPYPSLETLGPNHVFNASEGSDALQPSAPDTADDDKAYLRNVATGATDPDTAVLTDHGRPLVFYELLDNNAHTLKLAKVSGAIQFTVE